MIEKLTEEQKQWVRDNHHKYSWRRLAEEFDRVYPNSFNTIWHSNYGFAGYSQMDGQWLCEESHV